MSRRLLTAEEAATYLDFPTRKAFDCFLYRRRQQGRPIRTLHRGRAIRFLESDLDAAFDVEESQPAIRRRSA